MCGKGYCQWLSQASNDVYDKKDEHPPKYSMLNGDQREEALW
jgi:hypothetical protein